MTIASIVLSAILPHIEYIRDLQYQAPYFNDAPRFSLNGSSVEADRSPSFTRSDSLVDIIEDLYGSEYEIIGEWDGQIIYRKK